MNTYILKASSQTKTAHRKKSYQPKTTYQPNFSETFQYQESFVKTTNFNKSYSRKKTLCQKVRARYCTEVPVRYKREPPHCRLSLHLSGTKGALRLMIHQRRPGAVAGFSFGRDQAPGGPKVPRPKIEN